MYMPILASPNSIKTLNTQGRESCNYKPSIFMAISKPLVFSLLISLLLLHLAQSDDDLQVIKKVTDSPLGLHKIDCDAACGARCQLSSRPRLCKRACGTCCARCDCVPPGTSGNYDVCPCYANMTTHGGRHKCP